MMTLLYVGAPATLDCQQPVIVSLDVVQIGMAGAAATVGVFWTVQHATRVEIFVDNVLQEGVVSGNEAQISLAFGASYAIKLCAYCDDLMSQQTADFTPNPCETPVTIDYFYLSNDGLTVTLEWFVTEGYNSKLYRDNALIAETTGNGVNSFDDTVLGDGIYNYKVVAYQSLYCYVEAMDSIIVGDMTFYPFANSAPSLSFYHLLYNSYSRGVKLANLNVTSNGTFIELVVTDIYGQQVDLTDIDLVGSSYESNRVYLQLSVIDFSPSVNNPLIIGKINNKLALKIPFLGGTNGTSAVGTSRYPLVGDVFMSLVQNAGLSPVNPTAAATTQSSSGLIPNNGQYSQYSHNDIANMTADVNGNIWLSFQLLTHSTYRTPNHATVSNFTYNQTDNNGYGVSAGNSVALTDLKYRQFEGGDITVIGGYVNKAALQAQSPQGAHFVTVDSVSWY